LTLRMVIAPTLPLRHARPMASESKSELQPALLWSGLVRRSTGNGDNKLLGWPRKSAKGAKNTRHTRTAYFADHFHAWIPFAHFAPFCGQSFPAVRTFVERLSAPMAVEIDRRAHEELDTARDIERKARTVIRCRELLGVSLEFTGPLKK